LRIFELDLEGVLFASGITHLANTGPGDAGHPRPKAQS
jgi:hypothetical protein